MRDGNKQVQYVGITKDPKRRQTEHDKDPNSKGNEMRHILERTPFCNKPPYVELHDSRIKEIICKDNSIRFVIDENGFCLVFDEEECFTDNGSVKLLNCDPDDFRAVYLKRKANPNGPIVQGIEISLRRFIDKFHKDKLNVRFGDQYYCEDAFLWVLEIYEKKRLSDWILIYSDRCPNVAYEWHYGEIDGKSLLFSKMDNEQNRRQLSRWLREPFRNMPLRVDLREAVVNDIVCKTDSIQFVFDKGFHIVQNDRVMHTKNGYLELRDCDPEGIYVLSLKSRLSFKNKKMSGREVTIREFAIGYQREKPVLEIGIEMYCWDIFLLEAVVRRKRGLPELVVMYSHRCPTMLYGWE